ncbi:hypothetical protein ACS5PU_08080 [Pedobacter sp. GSP4]|uniref:hypothetical protein n=1 Tax=Pedobacter sp. GSP4 TaxID=3453716 RepID=UPI003EEB94C1
MKDLGFLHKPLLNKPDWREELPILHRNSYQKAGLNQPNEQNLSFSEKQRQFYMANAALPFALSRREVGMPAPGLFNKRRWLTECSFSSPKVYFHITVS